MPDITLPLTNDTLTRLDARLAILNAQNGTTYNLVEFLQRNAREMAVQDEHAAAVEQIKRASDEAAGVAINDDRNRLLSADALTPLAPGEKR